MKQQICIFSILHLVLTSQEKEPTEDYNSTYIDYGPDGSAPCNDTVPGFNSLGLMVTYITVFAFSVVGNAVVVYVVCCMKGRASTDFYLMHLALADLVFSITLPFSAVEVHFGWLFGNVLCKLLSGLQEASMYSGVFLLACISVERYFAIVMATRVLSPHHLLAKVVCGMVWLVAAALSLPVVVHKESLYDDLEQSICYENLAVEIRDRWRVSVSVLRHTLGFFLPLAVMAVCYGWTVATLFSTRNQQKHKAMGVILAVVTAFVLCWLPYNVSVLVDTLTRGGLLADETCASRYALETVLSVTKVFAFAHCAVNPVLYAFIGQKFRNQLLWALYKQGLISNRTQMAYRSGSVTSAGSVRSRNTSVTV